jgi:hypothetical protein
VKGNRRQTTQVRKNRADVGLRVGARAGRVTRPVNIWRMSEPESFEDRLRAVAEEIGRSVQRMSEVDLEEVAERYGVDADRARAFADAAGKWLSGRLSNDEPLFGRGQHSDHDSPARGASEDFEAETAPSAGHGQTSAQPGPHPLDLPIGRQGVALSALDSGRWTVRPGSNQLAGTGEGTPPSDAPDLVSELRARDWITAGGTLTLVGRHALARWCRTAEDPAPAAPGPDAPPDL